MGSAWCWAVGTATPAVPLGVGRVRSGAGPPAGGCPSGRWQCPGPAGLRAAARMAQEAGGRGPSAPGRSPYHAAPCFRPCAFRAPAKAPGVAGAHQAGDGLGLTSAPLLPTQLLAAAAVPCPSSWEVRSVTANTSSGRTAAVPAQPCGGRHVPQPPSSSDPLSTPRNCGSGRLGGRGSGQERPSPGPAPDTACSGHWPLARSLGSVSLPPGEPPAPWGAATPSPWEWLPFLLQ